MQNEMFKGIMTATVTPFNSEGEIDFVAFDRLIDFQLNNNVNGIVFCGTTGESPTLSENEKLSIFEYAVKKLKDKVPVIAGTGSNNTAASISLSQKAKEIGVDGLLLVTPYYNKPTQEGLFLHYTEIAANVDLPICLYNVPSRTSIHMLPETVARLSKVSNIVAVKEAKGDMDVIKEIRSLCGDDFVIMSGDDGSYIPALESGANGLISVISNIMPAKLVEMTELFNQGQQQEAAKEHDKLGKLYKMLGVETNPIPVKTFLHLMKLIECRFRLPLCPASNNAFEQIKSTATDYELI